MYIRQVTATSEFEHGVSMRVGFMSAIASDPLASWQDRKLRFGYADVVSL